MQRLLDILRDSANSLLAAPLRLFGTVLPITIAVALLVSTSSLAETARFQVAEDFDALRSTEVRVLPTDGANGFPVDYRERLLEHEEINSVEQLRDHGSTVLTSMPSGAGVVGSGFVLGVDGGGPQALHALVTGRKLDLPASLQSRSALVGARLAAAMGLGPIDGGSALWINGSPVTIVGRIDASPLDNRLLDAVVLLEEDAVELTGNPQGTELILDVAPGAAAAVAEAVPLILRPDDPSAVIAVAPPDPELFRERVEDSVRNALLALGWITLLVGLLLVAVLGWANVTRRSAEFGLHRALGARQRDVFLMVAAEGSITGCIGGLAGVSLGVVATVAIAVRLGWNPVVSAAPLVSAFGIALVVTVVAGIVPALRAARMAPAIALRAGE